MEDLGWQDQGCLWHTSRNLPCEDENQGHLAAKGWGHRVCHIGVYGICCMQLTWCWHDPGQWAGQLGWFSLGRDIWTHGGQHITSSFDVDLDMEWGCSLTTGTCRQLYYCICLHYTVGHGHHLPQSLLGEYLLQFYNQLHQQTAHHMGVFPQCWPVPHQLLSLSMSLMTGDLLSSIWHSGLLAGRTRTVALCMPVTYFWTAFADGILCRAVVMVRVVWMGAVGALWGTLLWLVLLCLMALAEGMDGFTGTHHSCSRLYGILGMTNLQ